MVVETPILIVDDEPDLRDFLQINLRRGLLRSPRPVGERL